MAQEIANSTLIDTWASSGVKIEPDISKIIEGWQLGEQPPHEYMNWLQNTFGSKLNHILKNGVASWNNKTQYLAGSSVQHNGNIWLCKTTNTNSAPTDANANWTRIITVESLTTVLGGYVALADFIGSNQRLAANGYQKLPGGLIIQWAQGLCSVTPNTPAAINLPITFPNKILLFFATSFPIGSYVSCPNVTNSSVSISSNIAGAGTNIFAIGY